MAEEERPDTMRVEFLELVKDDGDIFQKGDIVTVPWERGHYFVGIAGWAKDSSGHVQTAPRDTQRVVRLKPENIRSRISVSDG